MRITLIHCGECGYYDRLGKGCICSRKKKFMLQRANLLVVIVSFFIFLVQFIIFWNTAPEAEIDTNNVMKFLQSDVASVLAAYLLGGISYLWAAICFFGTFTVGCRWYPCLPLLSLLTFSFAGIMFGSGAVKE
jgi:hypothetical protein